MWLSRLGRALRFLSTPQTRRRDLPEINFHAITVTSTPDKKIKRWRLLELRGRSRNIISVQDDSSLSKTLLLNVLCAAQTLLAKLIRRRSILIKAVRMAYFQRHIQKKFLLSPRTFRGFLKDFL